MYHIQLFEEAEGSSKVAHDLLIYLGYSSTRLVAFRFFCDKWHARRLREIIFLSTSPFRSVCTGIIGMLVQIGQLQVGIATEAEGDGTIFQIGRIFTTGVNQFENIIGIGYDTIVFFPAIVGRSIVLLPIIQQIMIETHTETSGHNHVVAHQ